MDRNIIYVGQVPLDTDQLSQSKNTMIALGMAMRALLGVGTWFDGLACTPTGPASLQVLVGPGSVYALENLDSTAYGSLASDTTHQIVKQGINLGTLTLNCPAPGTTGQSVNYLIQSDYQDTDTGSTVLPYYNSSNPAVAFNGPNNTGVSQNTVRQGQCIVTVKAGVAATTGSQTTPAPDAGFTGLWVVTVANSQTTITSGNISLAPSAPFIAEKLNDKVSIPTGNTLWMPLGGGGGTVRTVLNANTTYHVSTTGNDSTGTGSSGAPWRTAQHAINVIMNTIDLAGFDATIQRADSTSWTDAVSVTSSFTGGGRVILQGNTGTPDNCTVTTTSADNIFVSNGGVLYVQGFKLSTVTSGNGLIAGPNGTITVLGSMDFGACVNDHAVAIGAGAYVQMPASYTISGSCSVGSHLAAQRGGSSIDAIGCSVTLTGTPSSATAYAYTTFGNINVASSTFSGSATGVRYNASLNGIIDSGGGGATYLPGGTSGTTATGGQYN